MSSPRPRRIHSIPAFFAGLVAALFAAMVVNGVAAIAGGEPITTTLVLAVATAFLAVLPFGPLAALAFVPSFLALHALGAFRPWIAALLFGVLALILSAHWTSSIVGTMSFGVAGLAFGAVSALVFAVFAARDAS